MNVTSLATYGYFHQKYLSSVGWRRFSVQESKVSKRVELMILTCVEALQRESDSTCSYKDLKKKNYS